MELVFQNFTKDKSFKKDFFARVLEAGREELDLKNISVSINLVGEVMIKELNVKYRNKEKVTDVLSFPMSERLEIDNWKSEIPRENTPVFDLGDIFICLPFAKKEAKSENISIDRKLAQLTVHGFLHLLGFDHEISEKDAKKMFELEARILENII